LLLAISLSPLVFIFKGAKSQQPKAKSLLIILSIFNFYIFTVLPLYTLK